MMLAGSYYVGDLCYVFSDEEWQEVCHLMYPDNDPHASAIEGELVLTTNNSLVPFAIYGTAYGDGCYEDNYGNEYGVDSGTLGCVWVEFINKEKLDYAIKHNLGHAVEFFEDFETKSDCDRNRFSSGRITFGHVVIETDPLDDDDEDLYGDDDE